MPQRAGGKRAQGSSCFCGSRELVPPLARQGHRGCSRLGSSAPGAESGETDRGCGPGSRGHRALPPAVPCKRLWGPEAVPGEDPSPPCQDVFQIFRLHFLFLVVCHHCHPGGAPESPSSALSPCAVGAAPALFPRPVPCWPRGWALTPPRSPVALMTLLSGWACSAGQHLARAVGGQLLALAEQRRGTQARARAAPAPHT